MLSQISKLSIREKLILIAAATILIGILIHGLVISPYQQKSINLAEQIEQAKSDLLWMQDEVKNLPASIVASPTASFNGSLANLINQQVATQNLKNFLSQITPVGNDEMRVRYTAINFNELITFVTTLKNRGLSIKNVQINSTGNIATVDATIVFRKSI